MKCEQLLLFEESYEDKQDRRIDKIDDSVDRLRKSLHAKNNVHEKRIKLLESKLEFLEAHICKGNLFL